jgi:hypothetical protein
VTEAKRKLPTVHAPAKRLVEALLAQMKFDLQAAAAEAGMSTREARVYLGKHHVIAFYRAEKRRLIEEISLGNPAALAEIRSSADNSMARVAAIKTLEQMRTDAVVESGGEHRTRPGLVIVIHSPGGETRTIGPQSARMIDVTPPPEHAELEPSER